ncbi:hypothetical protein CPC08DRAFT_107591 [Agrocybe pediades]|nr:hypothetical protein CPC08DRAFT_107591 [Agrocybe pediades]
MQAMRNTSLITTLNDDLLLTILLEITNYAKLVDPWSTREQIRPIVTTRHCSHICCHWRSIMLSSSTIWGRLVDLDYLLSRKTDDWTAEIMERAGEALLWVYGSMVDYQGARNHLLSTFLQENWARVEMLVVTDALHSILEQRKKMWAFLHEPAPRLRWVDLSVDTMDADEFLPVPWNLFADKAPLLTEFRMDRYKFWTDASWIPNLCDVTFYSDFHPSEALEAVQGMPHLQYLDVSIGIDTITESIVFIAHDKGTLITLC